MPKIGSRSKISQQQQQTEKMFQHHPESTTPKKQKINKTYLDYSIRGHGGDAGGDTPGRRGRPHGAAIGRRTSSRGGCRRSLHLSPPVLPYPPNLPTLLP